MAQLTLSTVLALFVLSSCGDSRPAYKKNQKSPPPSVGSVAISALQIAISADKNNYSIGTPIALTVVYTNNSSRPIKLWASGLASMRAFDGETYVISNGDGQTEYTFFGIDPEAEGHLLKPGGSWSRDIPDLQKQLTSGGTLVDGEHKPSPIPFAQTGKYTIQIRYAAVAKNMEIEKVYKGNAASNAISITME